MAIALAATIPAFSIFGDRAGPWFMTAWFAAVGMMAAVLLRLEKRHADSGHRQPAADERRRHCILASIAGLLWTLPVVVYPAAAITHAPRLAAMQLLLAAYLCLLAVAPVPAAAFAAVFGIGGAAVFCLVGEPLVGIVHLAFVVAGAGGGMIISRLRTGLRLAGESLAESRGTISLLLRDFEDNDGDWLWEIDRSRRVRRVSPRFAHTLGIAAADAEGLPLTQLIAGDGWETGVVPRSLGQLADTLNAKASFSALMVRVWLNGAARWWELSGTPQFDERGRFAGFRGVGSDVTERTESAEKIARLARYDHLTGLPNRMMLTHSLRQAMEGGEQGKRQCGLLMIDLDRFRTVNDTLGHQMADALLTQVSARLRACMGKDDICGRLGADEFAVVVGEAGDRRALDQLAATIVRDLSQSYDVDGHTVWIGASIGSATFPCDGITVETLMHNAEIALYRAKEAGGGDCLAYEPGMHADAEERRRLEFALRNALVNDELSLAFQPVVDAKSEEIVSFEALLRWNSAEYGAVGPARFIPIAEDSRLILPIGEWALRRACEEAATWPDHIRIAVNVSPEQLLQPAFAATVIAALAATGLEPHRLELEVTESIFLRDGAKVQANFRQLEALGCTIALDDFGTGYSSLGYLSRQRFSTIKIDRSFVTGADSKSAEKTAIIAAVVAIADALDMTTTAEGVENAVELEQIRKLGCTKIQGFLFGRPMSARDVRALFQDHDGRRRA